MPDTDIPNRSSGRLRRSAVAGAALKALALIGLGWGVVTFGVLWRAGPVEALGKSIAAGAPFSDAVLASPVRSLEQPASLLDDYSGYTHSAALVRMRHFDNAVARESAAEIDRRMIALSSAITTSLALAPSDSFVWFARYWFDVAASGYTRDKLKFLVRSYELGPRELWIAESRNRVGLTVFSEMANSQDFVVSEFSGLFDIYAISEVARLVAGPGWPVRERLLAALSNGDASRKLELIRVLGRQGIRINIPGVPEEEERPWR